MMCTLQDGLSWNWTPTRRLPEDLGTRRARTVTRCVKWGLRFNANPGGSIQGIRLEGGAMKPSRRELLQTSLVAAAGLRLSAKTPEAFKLGIITDEITQDLDEAIGFI